MSQQFFELSGDDEQANRAEAAEHDTEALIEAIFNEASCYCDAYTPDEFKAVDRNVAKAIDRAMSHAYAEGRADEREDWVEKSLRAMNETGQGEHGWAK